MTYKDLCFSRLVTRIRESHLSHLATRICELDKTNIGIGFDADDEKPEPRTRPRLSRYAVLVAKGYLPEADIDVAKTDG